MPEMTVEVPWNDVYEGTPFLVTVTITHSSEMKVDPTSFEMMGKKLDPRLVKAVQFQGHSPLLISIYTFEQPGLLSGLQQLPAISASVGGKRLTSSPLAFEVKKEKKEGRLEPFLKLEPIFTGETPLYPGQIIYVGYRYSFNVNIDLVEEVLPLLEAMGFKKIGDKRIEEGEERGVSTRQIVQKAEALSPGEYVFGPSLVKGYPYTLDAKGEKIYAKSPLISEAKPLQIAVASFPKESRPAAFDGAVGDFSFRAELMGSKKVSLGDRITLRLEVEGEGEFDTVKPPDLCCQPGFSGFFGRSDLPPTSEKKGNVKAFQVELEVKNRDVEAIPPILFSFFNPKSKSYATKKSAKIPLEIISREVSSLLPKEEAIADRALENHLEEVFALPLRPFEAIPLLPLVVLGLAFLAFYAHLRDRS